MKTLSNIGATLLWAGKLAALIALIVVLVRVEGLIKRADSTVINFDGGLTDARTLLQNTDRSVNGTGDLKPQDKALLPAAVLAIKNLREIEAGTSRQEQAYWTNLETTTKSLGDRAALAFDLLNEAIDGVNKSQARIADDAHQSFGKLNDALDHVPGFIDQSTATLRTAQGVIGDPNIPLSLKEIADSAQHVDETTVRVAAMAQDIQGKVHSSTHPSKRSVAFGIIYHLALAGATHIP